MTMERSCCQGKWRSRFAKLGVCARCMRLSFAITVGSWLAVAVAPNLGLAPAMAMSVLAVALAATALTVAHFAVFLARVRVVTEMRSADGSLKPVVVQYRPDRRAFLARSLAGSVGALAAVLLGRAETAAAPAAWCVYTVTFTNDCRGITVGAVPLLRVRTLKTCLRARALALKPGSESWIATA